MSAFERLQMVRRALKAQLLEREVLVDGVLLAVLARQHVLMLGPPGTAKSMLAKQACRRIGGQVYFEWLLTKFTTPEEIFGPVSLEALEAGRYERVVSGKLPQADIAFLDEVFKANSAILNALLTVLNERQFHQGSQAMNVPLVSLLAASNELPDEDELSALYDRFLLRFTVGYIEHDYQFAKLLRLSNDDPDPQALLTGDDLISLQAAVDAVKVSDGVLADLVELRRKLQSEGVIASDRRYRQALTVLKASAVLEGRDTVGHNDLAWLEHVLWSEPEDQRKVAEVLSAVVTGFEEDAQRLLFQAKEIDAYARRAWPDEPSKGRAVLEAHTKLEDISRRLQTLKKRGEERGRDVTRLQDMLQEVVSLQRNLLGTQDWN